MNLHVGIRLQQFGIRYNLQGYIRHYNFLTTSRAKRFQSDFTDGVSCLIQYIKQKTNIFGPNSKYIKYQRFRNH